MFYINSEKCYCAVLRYIVLSLVKSFTGAKDVSIDTRSINRQVIRNKYNWKSDRKRLVRSMIRVFASLKIVR